MYWLANYYPEYVKKTKVDLGWQFSNFSLTKSNLFPHCSSFFCPIENPLVNFSSSRKPRQQRSGFLFVPLYFDSLHISVNICLSYFFISFSNLYPCPQAPIGIIISVADPDRGSHPVEKTRKRKGIGQLLYYNHFPQFTFLTTKV